VGGGGGWGWGGGGGGGGGGAGSTDGADNEAEIKSGYRREP